MAAEAEKGAELAKKGSENTRRRDVPMKAILPGLVASLLVWPAIASGPYDRSVCEILRTSEQASIFVVHIMSGSDMCHGKQCFAASYTAKVVKTAGGNKSFVVESNIKFVTSSKVQIGTEVMVIAQPIPRNSYAARCGFLGASRCALSTDRE